MNGKLTEQAETGPGVAPKEHVAAFVARAHWSIFLPAFSAALLWALVYLWADNWTPRLSAIAWLALAVEGLIVPILILHAWGRTRVLGLRVG
ncbi:MAG: hypothetical protein ABJI28_07665, partial [Nitratireductor sp.]